MDENLTGKGLTIPETHEGHTVLEGWLLKRGAVVKNLKRRYFILSRGRMDYYHDLDKEKEKYLKLERKGTFPIHNAQVVHCRATYELLVLNKEPAAEVREKPQGGLFTKLMGGSEEMSTDFGFCVRSEGRVLMLYAKSKQEMDEWNKAISRCNEFDPLDTENPPPVKDGWLVKTSSTDAEQKLRYAVLYDGRMNYFEDSADEQVKVCMPLNDVRVELMPSSSEDGSGSSKFQVAGRDGVWYFEAANDFEANSWVEAIQQSVNFSPSWIPIQKEGWMVKLGHRTETLTRRYFVLSGGLVAYYVDETMTSELGRIPVRGPGVKVDLTEVDSGNASGFSFKIFNGKEELICTAPTEEKRTEWLEAIREVAS